MKKLEYLIAICGASMCAHLVPQSATLCIVAQLYVFCFATGSVFQLNKVETMYCYFVHTFLLVPVMMAILFCCHHIFVALK